MEQSLFGSLKALWCHIGPKRHRQFYALLILMLLTSLAEVVSIGAVLPFLGALTTPERIFALNAAQPFIGALGLTRPIDLLAPLTIAFGLAAVIAGLMRLLLLWSSTKLSFLTGADLSIEIYRRTLYQPYIVHCSRNSSEIIDGISVKANAVVYDIIVQALIFISSNVILIFVLLALVFLSPPIALTIFGGFGLLYGLIILATRKRLLSNSRQVALKTAELIKTLQEGLGGIRDVLIGGNQSTYLQIYQSADFSLRRAQANTLFIGLSPRYIMEALSVLLIAVLTYFLAQQSGGISTAIPTLGVLALGAQRLLPVLQQAYSSWTQIRGGQATLQAIIKLLDQPLTVNVKQSDTQRLPFDSSICIKNLGFRYNENLPYIFKQVNIYIPKGSRVGFIGKTGSGKSTLLDIVMGLLQPTEGGVEVDSVPIVANNKRIWQDHIAHVPQTIFLADSTIEENIAFGLPRDQINQERVRKAAQQANIGSDIESWPKKYQTLVGERGVRLSGGQRQRIGIARALYKKADVIILDEATSALDSDTEGAVMEALEYLTKDITVLIIAHRLTTLKNCTEIFELGDGGVRRSGSYHEIVSEPALTGSIIQ